MSNIKPHSKQMEYEKLVNENVLHVLKRVRQTMHMLYKLGIKSADSNLKPCKDFVWRQRKYH